MSSDTIPTSLEQENPPESSYIGGLMLQYLGVLNRAIEQQKSRPVVGGFWPWSHSNARKVGLAIYKNSAQEPFDEFTIELAPEGIRFLGRGTALADAEVKVPISHLTEVVERAEEFAQHPTKLNLDWLARRVGLL